MLPAGLCVYVPPVFHAGVRRDPGTQGKYTGTNDSSNELKENVKRGRQAPVQDSDLRSPIQDSPSFKHTAEHTEGHPERVCVGKTCMTECQGAVKGMLSRVARRLPGRLWAEFTNHKFARAYRREGTYPTPWGPKNRWLRRVSETAREANEGIRPSSPTGISERSDTRTSQMRPRRWS